MNEFVSTSLVYFCVDALAVWSLNIQYGYTGIVNFGWIMFQAVGAYVAGALALGPSNAPGQVQHYILGANLPFPLPLLGGALAGALLSLIVGGFLLARRIRPDFQAVIMLILALIAFQVVTYEVPLFNGAPGISGVPHPFAGVLNLSSANYQWVYVGWALLLCAVMYVIVERLCRSSWGRAMRAVREDDVLTASAGVNVQAFRIVVFVIGGAIAGLSGGLLVEFLGAWSPNSWGYAETLVVFAAMYVGGRANNRGVLLGVVLVPVLLGEMPSFLPTIGFPGLIHQLSWIVIGTGYLLSFYFWPRGIFPERRLVVRPPGEVPVAATLLPEREQVRSGDPVGGLG